MKALAVRVIALSTVAAPLLLAFGSTSCKSGPPPKADIETLNKVVGDSTQKLLEDVRSQDSGEDLWVAWVGVDNQSSVPLGAAQEDTNRTVSETLVNARQGDNTKAFRMISEQQVKAAMNAASITRPNELTIKAPREKFLAQLTSEGRIPSYLMFGTFSSADSGDERVEERRFRLSLQMMHASSGEIVAERSGVFTKEAN